MNEITIDAVRDLALTFEESNLEVAYELMSIAHENRPNGGFIIQKMNEYSSKLNSPEFKARHALNGLVKAGDVAIIPVGFRCFTKMKIRDQFGVVQGSLPFDSGFFPPSSVVSVFENPIVDLFFEDEGTTHFVCQKQERFRDDNLNLGIAFSKSSYEEIDSTVRASEGKDVTRYLDNTFGYYTLDASHNFVLAHYNWHPLADPIKSKGITNPEENLKAISAMMNKRIARMIKACETAKYIFFIYGEYDNYTFMKIDDDVYELGDLDQIRSCVEKRFDAKCVVASSTKFGTARDILEVMQVEY